MAATPGGDVFSGSYKTGMWQYDEVNEEWQRKMKGMGTGLSKMIMEAPDDIYGIQEYGYSGCVVYTASIDSAWQQRADGIGLEPARELVRTNNGDLFGSFGTRLYHSVEDGVSWDSIPNQWEDATASSTKIEQMAAVGGTVYLHTKSPGGELGDQVFFSNDNGTSWNSIFSMKDYNDNVAIPQDEVFAVDDLLVTSAGDVYLDIRTLIGKDALLLREAGSTDWTMTNKPFAGPDHYTLDRNDALYVYDFIPGDIYFSSDKGQTWDTIANGGWGALDNNYSTLHLRFDHQNRLYAGHQHPDEDGEIWFRNEHGEWQDLSETLPTTTNDQNEAMAASPMDIQFDEQDTPYVLTRAGIYAYAELQPSGLKDRNTGLVEAATVFPNPATNMATVQFALQEGATIGIEILDVTGRTLAHITRMKKGAGSHTHTFSVEAMPRGSYFICIKSGAQQRVVKLLKQ
jgi:hypothetical protein